jgi:long-subunit fatty acid transport protein
MIDKIRGRAAIPYDEAPSMQGNEVIASVLVQTDESFTISGTGISAGTTYAITFYACQYHATNTAADTVTFKK